MAENNGIVDLVRLIVNGVEKYGLKNIKTHLKLIDGNKPTFARYILIKRQILREISNVYGVSPKAIVSSKERGNTTQAKVTAIILFHIHLGVTQKKIARMLGYDPPIVSSRIGVLKKITCDETGTPLYESQNRFEKVYDKKFMRNFSLINKNVKDYIITNLND